MKESNVISSESATPISDPLTEILRQGARRLLAEAVETEVSAFLTRHADLKLENGQARLIRNGYLPAREVLTGVGAVRVQVPRVRDRHGERSERLQFHSGILPPYLRRSLSVSEVLPWLYLKGISCGDMGEALSALLGETAAGLSAGTLSRLKMSWEEEYEAWKKRDLSGKHYVYWWVDGIYSQARMEERQCLLVIIGATADGHKELVAVEEGWRESAESWKALILSLKAHGLDHDPLVAVGDGGLGFWKALAEVCPSTQGQRCWVHKTANVLNALPKTAHSRALQQIHEITKAENRKNALQAIEVFSKNWGGKYPKAVECLQKDRDALLRYYDFPAEHWVHLRTTNPIESTFATVRLRTDKVRSCFSSKTLRTMIYRLCLSAEKSWRKLNGLEQLRLLSQGATFVDGVLQEKQAA